MPRREMHRGDGEDARYRLILYTFLFLLWLFLCTFFLLHHTPFVLSGLQTGAPFFLLFCEISVRASRGGGQREILELG